MLSRSIGFFGLVLLLGPAAHAQTILGSVSGYAAMAGGAVTINGTSNTITGNLGSNGNIVSPGTNYTVTDGSQMITTVQNQADFDRAFAGLSAMTPTADLTGMILGTTAGATVLTPGVYHFSTTAQLSGALTLDARNQSNAVWVFQIGTAFTTAAGASVTFVNLAPNSADTDGLFWQVGTATILGANTLLAGNILGGTSFDFGSGAMINEGRALTASGAINFDDNTIDFGGNDSGYSAGLAFIGSGSVLTAAVPVPEPTTSALIGAVSVLGLAFWQRRRASIRVEARPQPYVGFCGQPVGESSQSS